MLNSDDLSVNHFGKICRTCLSEGDIINGEMKFLYEKSSEKISVLEKLMFITFIDFSENDGLPVQICTNCISELTRAYRFAQKCAEVDKKLRKCLKEYKIGVNNETNIKNSELQIQTEIEIDKQQENEVNIPPEIIVIKQEVCDSENNYFDNIYEIDNQNDTDFLPKNNFSEENTIIQLPKLKEPSYECKVCLVTFGSYQMLSRHWKEVNHPKTSKIPCQICSKIFKSSQMMEHIKTHSEEKPFFCEICGKSFITNSKLTRHRITHTGEKPHTCNICDKKFGEAKQLKEHLRIHTGERPYACDFCEKKFRAKFHLVRHTRIHTGDKPYRCNVCDRAFTQNSSLKTHVRTHTGEKPAVCNHCGKRFISNALLNWHLKSHASEKRKFGQ